MKRPDTKQIRRKFEDELKRSVLAEPGVHSLIIVLDNLKPDFNVGKIYRSAVAFGAREIHLVGIPFFNPYPARGATRQIKTYQYDSFEESYARLTELGYQVVVFDPKSSLSLCGFKFLKNSALILGHEEFGFSFKPEEYNATRVSIPQFGQVESLNVSIAASIGMYEYVRQFA